MKNRLLALLLLGLVGATGCQQLGVAVQPTPASTPTPEEESVQESPAPEPSPSPRAQAHAEKVTLAPWVAAWMRFPLRGEEAQVRRDFLLALNAQCGGQAAEARDVQVFQGVKGRPLAGALVYTAYGLAFTDAKGHCRVPWGENAVGQTPDIHHLAVFKPNFRPLFRSAKEDTPILLSPASSLEISGRLLDTGGRPLENFQLQLLPENPDPEQKEVPIPILSGTGGDFYYKSQLLARPRFLAAARFQGGYAQTVIERPGYYHGVMRLRDDGDCQAKNLSYQSSAPEPVLLALPKRPPTSWVGEAYMLKPEVGKQQLSHFPPWLQWKHWRWTDKGDSLYEFALRRSGHDEFAAEESRAAKRIPGVVRVIDGQSGKPVAGVIIYTLFDLAVTGKDGSVKGTWLDTQFIHLRHPDYEGGTLWFDHALTGKPIALCPLGTDQATLVVKTGTASSCGLVADNASQPDRDSIVRCLRLDYFLAHPGLLVATPWPVIMNGPGGGGSLGETYEAYTAGTWTIPIAQVNWPTLFLGVGGVEKPLPFTRQSKRVEVSVAPPPPDDEP